MERRFTLYIPTLANAEAIVLDIGYSIEYIMILVCGILLDIVLNI